MLPEVITSSIYAALNADLSSPPNAYVEYSLAFSSTIISYMFDHITINVPPSQLVHQTDLDKPYGMPPESPKSLDC